MAYIPWGNIVAAAPTQKEKKLVPALADFFVVSTYVRRTTFPPKKHRKRKQGP